jgi:predicted nicotinamide N-methyase/RimJ/RimL family protein N-acetyltransferase
MRDNWEISLHNGSCVLVPYRQQHVQKYHEWMQSEALLKATASEPLSLKEEYKMQRSWRDDPKKCTFIIQARKSDGELCMIGDTNLFFNDPEDPLSAEIEIMIAEPEFRRKGYATKSLKSMMAYANLVLGVARFVAKIGYDNTSSLGMFTSKSLGYSIFEKHDWCEETHCVLDVRDEEFGEDVKNNIQEWGSETVIQRNIPPNDEVYNVPHVVWSTRCFYDKITSMLGHRERLELGFINSVLHGLQQRRMEHNEMEQRWVYGKSLVKGNYNKEGSKKCESVSSNDSDESVPNVNFSGIGLFETDSMWYVDLPGGELKFGSGKSNDGKEGTSIFCINSPVGNNDSDDTGNITWDGAIAMAKWLERHPNVCKNKRVLELGAGTGFVGLSTLPCGSSFVYLTDLEYCLPLAQSNVEKNVEMKSISSEFVEVRLLDWFDTEFTSWSLEELKSIDVLVAADVIWQRRLVKPLAETIVRLLKLIGQKGVAYVLYTSRYGEEFDEYVLETFQSAHLLVEAQPHEEMDEVYRYDEAVVWKMTLQKNF